MPGKIIVERVSFAALSQGFAQTPGTAFRVLRVIKGIETAIWVRPGLNAGGHGTEPKGLGSFPIELGKVEVGDFDFLEFYAASGDANTKVLLEVQIWQDPAAAWVPTAPSAPHETVLAYTDPEITINPASLTYYDLTTANVTGLSNSPLQAIGRDGYRATNIGRTVSGCFLDGWLTLSGTFTDTANGSGLGMFVQASWGTGGADSRWELLHYWSIEQLDAASTLPSGYADGGSATPVNLIHLHKWTTGGNASAGSKVHTQLGRVVLPPSPWKLVLMFGGTETLTSSNIRCAIAARSA